MADKIQSCFARYEKKYRLTPLQQQIILDGLRGHAVPDEHGAYTICNLYYDTADWRLIRTSLEKPVYKEKLRVRSYGVPADGDPVFVELKKKYDGVVYKRRITTRADESASFLRGEGAAHGQIARELLWFQSLYRAQPKVFLTYDRVAFAAIDDPEVRITFDTGLRWRDTALDLRLGDWGAPIDDPDMVLLELKLPGVCPLWLSRLLSAAGAIPASYSKYGACYQNHLLPRRQEQQKEVIPCA